MKIFDPSNLYRFVKFYEYYSNIFDTLCRKSRILSWSHYRILIQVYDQKARDQNLESLVLSATAGKRIRKSGHYSAYFRYAEVP